MNLEVYLKGNARGIDNGYYDYQIMIQPGNYTAVDFVSYINNSFKKNVVEKNPYIDFGTTGVSYNSVNSKLTTTVDISSAFNEANYELEFASYSSYEEGTEIVSSIPQMLGYKKNNYVANWVYSNKVVVDPSSNSEIYNVTLKNNSVKIIQYEGVLSGSGSQISNINIDSSSNIIIDVVLSLLGCYSGLEIVNEMKSQLSSNENLKLGSLLYDASGSRYGINIVLDKKKIKNRYNTKTALIFPVDSSNALWTGVSSLFKYDMSYNELSDIKSEVKSKRTSYVLGSEPYIRLRCQNPRYDVSVIER